MEFQQPEQIPYLNAVVWGAPGEGKTVLISTMPGKGVILDCEGGLLSIRDKVGGRISAVKVTSFDTLREVFKELKQGGTGFEWVAIDSLTEAGKLCMDKVMHDQKDKDVPAMRDYLVCIEDMRKLIRAFRDLPMHVMFTALPKDDKDEQYGTIVRKPSLPGKLSDDACGYVDLIFYLHTQEKDGVSTRMLLTQPSERFYAKDRSGKLERFESADMAVVYKKIIGAKPKGKGGKAA